MGPEGDTRLKRIAALAGVALLTITLGHTTSTQARSHAVRNVSRLWVRDIQPNADSVPAYFPGVRLPDGRRRAVVYVVAGNNTSNCSPGDPVRRATTYAFDAANGALLWQRSTTGPSRCTTAGPAVDPSGRWVYVPGLDGKVHRYNAAGGAETRSHGWPHPVTLMPDVEKISATLTIGNGRLYVTTSGFIGDAGHYQGHLVTINLAGGQARVFNTLCSNIPRLLQSSSFGPNYCPEARSGLFGRGEGVVDPLTHDVYIVSGNGVWNGTTNWGDSVLKLDPSGTRLLDSYTPPNQAMLSNQDLDLGSTGPALLPPVYSAGRTYHLLIQGGKGPACSSCGGAALRLLNRDNLSGQGGPGHLGGDLHSVLAPGGQEVLTAPAVWRSPSGEAWAFYATNAGVAGYTIAAPSPGTFRIQRRWSSGRGGSTPVLFKGTLYVARDGGIDLYDPAGGRLTARAGPIGPIHWEYPLVVDHRIFMTDEAGHLTAFAL